MRTRVSETSNRSSEPASASVNRWQFIGTALAASAGAASTAPTSSPAPALVPTMTQAAQVQPGSTDRLPAGKFGRLTLRRLISGGNLISGGLETPIAALRVHQPPLRRNAKP